MGRVVLFGNSQRMRMDVYAVVKAKSSRRLSRAFLLISRYSCSGYGGVDLCDITKHMHQRYQRELPIRAPGTASLSPMAA